MNMKKLLTTTFLAAFFIISSAFFASAEETDTFWNRCRRQRRELQMIRCSRKQKPPKPLKNQLPIWFPLVFLRPPATAHAATVLQVGAEVPAPVLLPAPVTLLPLTQELSLMEPRL